MTKIIWIDLDEVLAESINFILGYHNYKIAGTSLIREDIVDYYIYNISKFWVSKQEAIEWFRVAMLWDNNLEIMPVLWALENLSSHKNKGYSFKIVTARQSEILSEYTQKWVEKHYPSIFENILFANHKFTSKDITKSELCKQHNIEMMVEDNFDYALDLAENWIFTFLLEKPWNKNFQIHHLNLKRVSSWEEIVF